MAHKRRSPVALVIRKAKRMNYGQRTRRPPAAPVTVRYVAPAGTRSVTPVPYDPHAW